MSDVELALSIYGQHGGGTQGVTAVWHAGYRAGRSDKREVQPRRHAVMYGFLDALDDLEARGLTEVWLRQPEVQRGLARLALLMDNTRASGELT
jgi:hypothetical protein